MDWRALRCPVCRETMTVKVENHDKYYEANKVTMPDLPPAEKQHEQRKALKWWVEHSAEQEIKIDELRSSLREMLVTSMKFYSELIFNSGWMNNLEYELTKDRGWGVREDIVRAAGLLGEIPTWDDSAPADEDNIRLSWRKFPLQ